MIQTSKMLMAHRVGVDLTWSITNPMLPLSPQLRGQVNKTRMAVCPLWRRLGPIHGFVLGGNASHRCEVNNACGSCVADRTLSPIRLSSQVLFWLHEVLEFCLNGCGPCFLPFKNRLLISLAKPHLYFKRPNLVRCEQWEKPTYID